MELPGRLYGTILTLTVDAEFFPLLRGEFRGGNVRLESPNFMVVLPAGEKLEKPLSLEDIERASASLLDELRKRAPGTGVAVRNGRMEISDADGPIVSLRDLEARAFFSPDRLMVDLRCASPFWDGLSIETEMRAEGMRSETRVETAGFRPRELIERLAPGAAPWLGDTVLSLRGRIEAEGLRSMRAEFAGAAPTLTLRRASRRLALKVKSAKGTVDLDGKSVRAVLSELVLQEPDVKVAGRLTVDRLSPRYEASLAGEALTIAPARRALLAIAGDVPAVRDILDVVRGGTSELLAAVGRPVPDGSRTRGRWRSGRGFPAAPSTSRGRSSTWRTWGARCRSRRESSPGKGSSRGWGTPREPGVSPHGIAGEDPPFHAEFQADAEAGSCMPSFGAWRRTRISGESWTGSGDPGGGVRRVVLGERLSDVGVRFTASKVRIAGTYDRVPFPIEVHEGSSPGTGDPSR
jgi:hypothetical protein